MKINQRIPNLFVLGAPKCGTTSIIHYLSQHPNIFVSLVKEPHYFNTDSERRYYKDEATYLQLFKDAEEAHLYRAEGSVWYLYSKTAVEEILKFNPQAKFIVMLREPVSMFFSLHQELLYGGAENEVSPKKAWELQEERAEGRNIPSGCSDSRILLYAETCQLGKQVKQLLQKVEKKQVTFITLDELKNDADKVYNQILKFLDVPMHHLPTYKVVNVKKVRKSLVLSQLLMSLTHLKRKLGIKGGLGVANAINKKNVDHGASLVNEKQPEFVNYLKHFFKDDVNLLSSLTGKDLTSWSNTKPSA